MAVIPCMFFFFFHCMSGPTSRLSFLVLSWMGKVWAAFWLYDAFWRLSDDILGHGIMYHLESKKLFSNIIIFH